MPIECTDAQIQQFLDLYVGRANCVLVQRLKHAKKHRSRSIKIEGHAGIDDRLELNRDLLLKHFNGGPSIGYTPLMSDGRVWSATIDLDIDLNIHELEELVRTTPSFSAASLEKSAGLPFSILRSKSDGAHMTAFFSEPIHRDNATAYLKSVSKALNFPLTEKVQMPNGNTTMVKVTEYRPTAEGDNDFANGGQVYLPYWGCLAEPKEFPTKEDENVKFPAPARVCVREGRELSLPEFLNSIQRVTESELLWPTVQPPRYAWQAQPDEDKPEKEKAKKPGRPKAEYFIPETSEATPAHKRAADKQYERRLERIRQMVEGMRDESFNKECWWTGRHLGCGALERDVATVREELAEAARASGLDENRIRYKTNRVLNNGISHGEEHPQESLPKIYAIPDEYARLAEQLVFECYTGESGLVTIHYHKEDYYLWTGFRQVKQSKDLVKHQAWQYLDGLITCKKVGDEFVDAPFKVNNTIVSNVINAVNAMVSIDGPTDEEVIAYPFWIKKPVGYPDADTILPNESGLTVVETEQTFDHTPLFFNKGYSQFAVPRSADERPDIEGWDELLANAESARAQALKEWVKFLRGIFTKRGPDGTYENGTLDTKMVMRLQEMMGLFLMAKRGRPKKIMYMKGPPRSGKGTIEQVIRKLLGKSNIVALSISNLSSEHGLENIVGRRHAVVTEARVPLRADLIRLVNTLLGFTEANPVSVNPKGLKIIEIIPEMDGAIYSNEAISLPDASGAIKARMVFLETHQSFADKVDDKLFDERLAPEAAAVYLWAVEGGKRLRANGFKFSDAPSVAEQEMLAGMNPFDEFLREFGYSQEVGQFCWRDMVYEDYKKYQENVGVAQTPLRATFFKELYNSSNGLMFGGDRRCGKGRKARADGTVEGLAHPRTASYTEFMLHQYQSAVAFEKTTRFRVVRNLEDD